MSTPGESAWALGFQPGGDADFCLEEFRDRTAGFGGFHGGVELRFVRPRNTRNEVEMALSDRETVGELVERNGCSRLELACGHAGVAELRGERHRETAGVRRGEELFRIGADPILKPRAERVLRLLQHATIRRNRALPIFQTALPNRGCFALHGFSPLALSFVLNSQDSILGPGRRVYSENGLVEKVL